MKNQIIILNWLHGSALLVLTLVLSPFIYLFMGPTLDGQAEKTATTMCDKVQVGALVSTFIALAKTYDADLMESATDHDGGVLYRAMFSGFLMNKFACEMYAKNEKVYSKIVEEHTW